MKPSHLLDEVSGRLGETMPVETFYLGFYKAVELVNHYLFLPTL